MPQFNPAPYGPDVVAAHAILKGDLVAVEQYRDTSRSNRKLEIAMRDLVFEARKGALSAFVLKVRCHCPVSVRGHDALTVLLRRS